MEAVKIVFVLCCMLECYSCWPVNEYDGPLSYECPSGQALAQIFSKYSDNYEDRQWYFRCASTRVLDPSHPCTWANEVNNYGKVMNFKCPSGGAITGIRSYPDKNYQDRRFDIKCCNVKKPSDTCKWTGYVNSYDGWLQYYIAPSQYINGISSTYSSSHGDRRYKFFECYPPE